MFKLSAGDEMMLWPINCFYIEHLYFEAPYTADVMYQYIKPNTADMCRIETSKLWRNFKILYLTKVRHHEHKNSAALRQKVVPPQTQ